MVTKSLWEILIPTEKRLQPGKYYSTKYHKVWDEKVRKISEGLTVLTPAKGIWTNSNTGEIIQERMIPVRILCSKKEIEKIVDLTLTYYDQLAVLCYKISDDVILKYKK